MTVNRRWKNLSTWHIVRPCPLRPAQGVAIPLSKTSPPCFVDCLYMHAINSLIMRLRQLQLLPFKTLLFIEQSLAVHFWQWTLFCAAFNSIKTSYFSKLWLFWWLLLPTVSHECYQDPEVYWTWSETKNLLLIVYHLNLISLSSIEPVWTASSPVRTCNSSYS